ncbi:cytochrome c3 family protein [Qipengyuania nanhaisediminis]|uniref:cytochrome c3 family protein n=1 Tax=Qipengyuania nanhaisediminis TaxID=604088 RepID=UPI0038B3530A
MTFLIRTIDHTAAGREIVRDRTLEQDAVTIGRASENDIHLPDLAVEQSHVQLSALDDGALEAEALSGLGFGLDGRTETSARIDPDIGAELSIGSSRLVIGREGVGAPVQITIRQAEKDAAAGDALAGFALASTLPSKRAMAWVLAGVILLLLLSVPIISHLTRSPAENDPQNLSQGQVAFDAAWSTGELSLAHHQLEENCEACHVTPFVSVQDETCLTCHEDIADHAAMPRQAKGMPPMSRGDAIQWSIAESFGKEGPLGCVSCHTEHEGPVALEAASEKFCADCHVALEERLVDVDFGNASDFGDAHPQFRPVIYTAHFADAPARISLEDSPREMSGLLFPHDVHLDQQGGVARMAINLPQYRAPLNCADCHREWTDDTLTAQIEESGGDAAAYGDFAPVNMERSCEACHSLVSGQTGGGFSRLRHGDVSALMEDLSRVSRPGRRSNATRRQRPGQFAPGGRYHSDFGRPMVGYIAINRALAPGGLCTECHIPTTSAGRADLTPVNLPHRFLLQGHFDHDAHSGEIAECSDCHAATGSADAGDLLIPEIAVCRDCHLGESAAPAQGIQPSGCAMCHGYHTPTRPWRPSDHPGHDKDSDNRSVAAILGSLRR